MWELIRANRRKSLWLFLAMGGLLALIGFVLGELYIPGGGGAAGFFLALALWLFWSGVAYYSGDSILLTASRAKPVDVSMQPGLMNVVEEMRIAANLPAAPKVYLLDDELPNAFATGRDLKHSKIVVTAGLVNQLNRYQLQGVVAHEVSHILKRDISFMTFAGVLLGSITMLSEVFLRSFWFAGGSRSRFRSRRSLKGSNGIIVLLGLLLAILGPVLSRIFYFAISRKREYLADASAVRLTRYPEGLASALEKISSVPGRMYRANSITAPMFTVSPRWYGRTNRRGLFSTHPPVKKRVKILRSLAGGVHLKEYERVFKKITGQEIVPSAMLTDEQTIPIFQPAPEKAADKTPGDKRRDLGDLMRLANGYIFLVCLCGLRIKIPPESKEKKVKCPRCSRMVSVPRAELATLTGLAATTTLAADEGSETAETDQLEYQRRSRGWETVKCPCGYYHQLSPSFSGTRVTCRRCKRITRILPMTG